MVQPWHSAGDWTFAPCSLPQPLAGAARRLANDAPGATDTSTPGAAADSENEGDKT